jgi:lactoylglutathione lyase
MPDLGLTHVALTAHDLDASIAFYVKYAGMTVVHRRTREGSRAVWLSDHTRPFVIVLVEAAGQQDHPLGPFGHLGVACASREAIDQLYAEACRRAGRHASQKISVIPLGIRHGLPTRTGIRLNSPLVKRSALPWSRPQVPATVRLMQG